MSVRNRTDGALRQNSSYVYDTGNRISTVMETADTGSPEVAGMPESIDGYDTVFVGFPIWWYVAPTIVNTFLEGLDLKGKAVVPFATSGGSGMGKTNERLSPRPAPERSNYVYYFMPPAGGGKELVMSKKLVAYFSASGVTASLARNLASAIGADLFEIKPDVPYTKADLDWTNKNSRSSVEMSDPSSRPAIAAMPEDIDGYDTVFVGFPIWWYVAPTIVNTFLEGLDLKGKAVVPFATSGGSGMGKTNERLSPSCPGAKLVEGKVWKASASADDLAAWAESVGE